MEKIYSPKHVPVIVKVWLCTLLVILVFMLNEQANSRNYAKLDFEVYYLDSKLQIESGKQSTRFGSFHKSAISLSDNQTGNLDEKELATDKYEEEVDSGTPVVNKKVGDTKYILYYSGHWNDWNPHRYISLSECEVSDCVLTTNQSLLQSSGDFDAVVVYHPLYSICKENGKKLLVPDQSQRKPHQRYIYYQRDTSQYMYAHMDIDLLHVDEIQSTFNWSMTFRLDSDLPIPYGWIDPIDGKKRDSPPSTRELPYKWQPYNNSNIIRSYRNTNVNLIRLTTKQKAIAWLVSHQKTMSFRYQYVEELKKYIDVDIYGKFGLKCGSKQNYESSNCGSLISQNYKFYLAFENSLCDYYISEKFWRAMTWDLIPIVLGDGAYNEVAPPHSYINVKDFATPKDLADYVIYLDNNDEEYLSYFWWKQHYKVVIGLHRRYNIAEEKLTVCEMCKRLHNHQEPPSQIQKFEELLTCRKAHAQYWNSTMKKYDSVITTT